MTSEKKLIENFCKTFQTKFAGWKRVKEAQLTGIFLTSDAFQNGIRLIDYIQNYKSSEPQQSQIDNSLHPVSKKPKKKNRKRSNCPRCKMFVFDVDVASGHGYCLWCGYPSPENKALELKLSENQRKEFKVYSNEK